MPKKTWFQHDMNCRKKEDLSFLLKVGGNAAYGIFWRLQELYMEMQTHRETVSNSFTINEASLVRELGINRRRLPTVMHMFRETMGIVFTNNRKTYADVSINNWHITLPKGLIFMGKRIPTPIIELEREREGDVRDILSHFSKKTGGSFRGDEYHDTVSPILNAGHSVKDANAVVDFLVEAWGQGKLKSNLRPSVVFGPKFKEYLDASKSKGGSEDEWKARMKRFIAKGNKKND